MGVFLDRSKTFDTVDHNNLFDNLAFYGVRGLPLDWLKIYFANRSQFVEYNGISSSHSTSGGNLGGAGRLSPPPPSRKIDEFSEILT